MERVKPAAPTLVIRLCNAWACLCCGFAFGFAACAYLQDRGLAGFPMWVAWNVIVVPVTLLAMGLPRAIVEIARLIRRYRQASA
ncbi:MAG TPA: hypothetical protein VIL86_20125 [Tepidisphaeraceae bacterium]|jgi:uncharacterized membrane protein YhdT